MGRPLNKKFFGNQAGALLLGGYSTRQQADGSPGPKGSPLADSDYILEQKSTNRFKIKSEQSGVSSTDPSFLVQTDHSGFANDKTYNEFSVDGYKDDGTRVFIEKFYNRTVIYTEDGVKKKAPWIKNDNLVTVGSDNQNQSITITVSATGTDVITIAAPAAFVANLSVGDTVVIFGSSQTALNGDHKVAGLTDATNFTVETLSSAGGTAGGVTSGTLMKKFPDAIIFDFKNAAT